MKNNNKEFKSVEFMREQRERLSKLYQSDSKLFYKELDEATKSFLELRKKQKLTRKAA